MDRCKITIGLKSSKEIITYIDNDKVEDFINSLLYSSAYVVVTPIEEVVLIITENIEFIKRSEI